MNIGQRIKQLRLERNITQPELAKAINVSNGLISFWENSVNEPKASLILKLAIYFNVSSDYLLGLEDELGNKISQNKTNNEYFIYNDGTHYIKHKKN